MPTTMEAMEKELERLIDIRERSVGIDLKRTNFKIAELQNRIDHATRADEPPAREPVPAPGLGERTYRQVCPHCGEAIEGTDLDDLKRWMWDHVKMCSRNPVNRTAPSTFDCDHQPRRSQPSDKNVFHSMDGFEEHYFQNDVEKYPVVYRRRVTSEEARAIDDWLEHRRNGQVL